MIKTCSICGREFETRTRGEYCSDECRKIARTNTKEESAQTAEYRRRLKARRESAEATGKRLAAMQLEARALGMSYGQYKAMLYMKEMEK